jgi:hypothetical protein
MYCVSLPTRKTDRDGDVLNLTSNVGGVCVVSMPSLDEALAR